MTNLQKKIQFVCEKLGLIVIVPYRFSFQGTEFDVQACIPSLGAKNGMLILSDISELMGLAKASEISNIGNYGFSVLSNSPELDLDSWEEYIAVFSDWGWSDRDLPKPLWMIDWEREHPEEQE